LLTFTAFISSAQTPVSNINISNLRQKVFSTHTDSLKIDTISIVPNTFSIPFIVKTDYRLDFVNAVLYWIKKPAKDSITVNYRVFPFQLNPVAQRMVYDSVVNNFYIQPLEINKGLSSSKNGVFDFGTLKAEGSFGRQIGFGNSQDAVVNSTLNLQLNGMLGDSIEINAAITDNNIPIQPDGNTQQLNEFDQVFLQFKKRNWQLNLGDHYNRETKRYFLNFYKRLKAVSFQTTNRINKSLKTNT
jgi:hypothetical protein